MAKLFIFGDSITFGAWDSEGGWVDRLRRDYAKENIDTSFTSYKEIYNLGIPGNTSTDVISRLEDEIIARSTPEEENSILFSIGINDASTIAGEHRVVENDFAENIKRMIGIGKRYAISLAFTGLTPVDEEKTAHIDWQESLAYLNTDVSKYEEIIEDITKTMNVPFIPLFKIMQIPEYTSLFVDGIHPNTNGHEMIYNIIKPALIQNKII